MGLMSSMMSCSAASAEGEIKKGTFSSFHSGFPLSPPCSHSSLNVSICTNMGNKLFFFFNKSTFSSPPKHSFTISANEVDMTTKDSIRSHTDRLSAAVMESRDRRHTSRGLTSVIYHGWRKRPDDCLFSTYSDCAKSNDEVFLFRKRGVGLFCC